MMAINLAIAGAGGRMGRILLEAAASPPAMVITGALEHAASPLLGRDAVELSGNAKGIVVTADLVAGLANAHVLIDFTRPEGTLEHLAACRKQGVNMVIGTTGFTAEQKREIDVAAKDIAIVFAANMSLGMNVLDKLVEMATKALHEDYDIEIIEAHHKLKVDAPSGTALMLGETVAKSIGKSLDEIGVFARHGVIGERKSGTIGFSTIRGGDIIGDHTVMYAGSGERIEITHRSSSRVTYAQGAMRAARFLQGRKAGLFDMQDVLGLK
jgi:4-hydroxy-tetrahydrodipicolinate reductase